MSNITNFPTWKANSNAIEKMREALAYMESHPEDMQNVLIVYNDENGIRQCLTDANVTATFAIGMLELAKHDLLEAMSCPA